MEQMVTIHLQDEGTLLVPSVWLKQAKKCLYCLVVFAVYHEQKYTVSQHLKIGRYGHAIVCKLQYYASAYPVSEVCNMDG